MPLLSAAWESNERAHRRFVELASDSLSGSLVGKKIAVWGLAFKAFTDDIRESPSLAIIDRLQGRGAEVIAYDPEVKIIKHNPNIKIVNNIFETLKEAELILVLTEWPEFSLIEPEDIAKVSSTKKIIDARGVLSKQKWKNAGFDIWGVKS
jgi:UDPglucose 6-dehydrogenase